MTGYFALMGREVRFFIQDNEEGDKEITGTIVGWLSSGSEMMLIIMDEKGWLWDHLADECRVLPRKENDT